jgi:hypothetical protein
MTERKPAGMNFESWVDKQVREATERGAFDNLPGMGKPLRDPDAPYDELWWIKRKMERENLSYLPPALALRKEAEEALADVRDARSERQVREIITEVNEKIRTLLASPPPGPVLGLKPFDVDEIVRDWRERHSA